MDVILVIGINGHLFIDQTTTFLEFLIGERFQIDLVGYLLYTNHVVTFRRLDGRALGIGHGLPAKYGGGPTGTKVTQGEYGHQAG
jgi:hypothetical protein